MAYTIEQHIVHLKHSIAEAAATGLKINVVIIGRSCCKECDKINNQVFPLEEVLKSPPLPHSKCTRKPFCFCCYGFQPVRDENNRLIRMDYTPFQIGK